MLSVQCLGFLLLENFNLEITPQGNSVEEMESGLIEMLSSRVTEYPFYSFATRIWFTSARSQLSDDEVWELSRTLFDPRKSNSFTQWALYLIWSIRASPSFWLPPQTTGTLLGVLNSSFTPFHLSAILGVPEICKYLLNDGIDGNSECHFGSAIDCAVSGLGILWRAVDSDFGDAIYDMKRHLHSWKDDTQHIQHHVSRTVDCVVGAQGPLLLRRLVASKPTLMRTAIMTCSAIMEFSMVAILIQNGIEPREEDHDVFQQAMKRLCSSIQTSYSNLRGEVFSQAAEERRLETFIRSLNSMIGTSPGAYAFCAIAWNQALRFDISFTSDISIVSSQISLDLKSLKELGMSGASTYDMAKLDTFLDDPRVSADGLACSTADGLGDTLLHLALSPGRASFAGFPSRLAVVQRLLEAGCMPSAINKNGDTPLHDWTWAEDADEAQKPEVENLIRSLLERGASIHTKGLFGSSVLHALARYSRVKALRAILDVVGADEAAVALAATDDQGFTPLMRALERNHAETAKVLIQYGKNEFGSLDNAELLSLAGGIQSVSLLQAVMGVGFPIKSDSGDSALHHIKRTTPVNCIRMLKEHLPYSCSQRVDGRLPIEIYLREWCLVPDEELNEEEVEAYLNSSFKVLKELAAAESQEECDEDGLSVWEYATARLVRDMRLGRSIDPYTNPDARRGKLFTEAVRHLMKLDYMRLHEATTGECGLLSLLRCLTPQNRNRSGLWPAKPRLLIEISIETIHWSQVPTSAIALDLLYTAFDMGDEPLLKVLLQQGIPLVHNGVVLDIAQVMCNASYETSPERYKACARMVLEYFPTEALEASDLVRGELALIHRAFSPWLAEELLLRGADPNLRTPMGHGHSSALVHHLLKGSPAVALHLLRRGADPEVANLDGVNAIHAALAFGHIDVLEAIHKVFDLPGHGVWSAKCNFWHQNAFWRALSGLELGALCGQLGSIKFLVENSDAEKLKKTPRARDVIYLAAAGGHDEVIRYLHQVGFDVNLASTQRRRTPLHAAVPRTRLSTINALIQLGAQLMEDREGMTPLDLAITLPRPQVAELLHQAFPASSRRAGAQSPQPVCSCHKSSAAYEKAIIAGDIHACKNLHQLGYPLDGELSCGCSYLAEALQLSSYSIARWLIDKGASLTRHSCVEHGNSDALGIWLGQRIPDQSFTDLLLKKYIQQGGDIFLPGLLEYAAYSPDFEKPKALLKAMESSIDNRK